MGKKDQPKSGGCLSIPLAASSGGAEQAHPLRVGRAPSVRPERHPQQ